MAVVAYSSLSNDDFFSFIAGFGRKSTPSIDPDFSEDLKRNFESEFEDVNH